MKKTYFAPRIINFFCSRSNTTERIYSLNKVLCGNIDENLSNKEVVLYGWISASRLQGKIFLLRDYTGIIQLISTNKKISDKVPSLESVVKVKGILQKRPKGQENYKMKTGEYEVVVNELEILNESISQMPLIINSITKENEQIRNQFRYLDLRREQYQNDFRFRSMFELSCSEFLVKHHDFVQISTPSLFCSTPGGAREFIVPTKFPGLCYSLIQSPQQHKQLLMVAGFDRYVQIARCYRDETSRPDRQPEFTQLDVEMSFVTRQHIQQVISDMLQYSFSVLGNQQKKDGYDSIDFIRLTYHDAMKYYGSDKPDLRVNWKIQQFNFNEVVCIGLRLSKQEFQALSDDSLAFVQKNKLICESISSLNILSYPDNENNSHQNDDDDVMIFTTVDDGDTHNVHSSMGIVRNTIIHDLLNKDVLKPSKQFAFVWIDEFPLFGLDGDRLKSLHHPFTAPIPEHEHLVYENPIKITGEQFDLVINGWEVGGGSIRIHKSELQRYILSDVLKEDVEEFNHLLTALKCGAPPHGGFALGLDRLMAVILGRPTIRDVIAFPKTSEGKDILSGAPRDITEDQQQFYHIRLANKSSESSN